MKEQSDTKADKNSDAKPAKPMGLRERKKEQTRLSVERAILRLVLQKGYENVTIEEVCEEVGISRKTFFNYFSSKRAAVMGRSYIPDKAQLLEAIEAHPEHNYLDVIVRCVEHGLTANASTDEILELRQKVMLASPEIFFRTNKSSLVLQPGINEALREYLEKHPEKRKMPQFTLEEECLTGTSVVVCLIRTHLILTSFGEETSGIKYARELVGKYVE